MDLAFKVSSRVAAALTRSSQARGSILGALSLATDAHVGGRLQCECEGKFRDAKTKSACLVRYLFLHRPFLPEAPFFTRYVLILFPFYFINIFKVNLVLNIS